jgi:transcriptional regulator with XRE-family HTH domain
MESKEYRDAFVAEQIFSRLPLKVRALREQRGLSQKELGERAGMAQAWVSKLEDPNYGKLTISTLLRLASAFDVGLHIDFVPFSQVLGFSTSLSEESFRVPSFAEDMERVEKEESDVAAAARVGAGVNVLHYHGSYNFDELMTLRRPLDANWIHYETVGNYDPIALSVRYSNKAERYPETHFDRMSIVPLPEAA